MEETEGGGLPIKSIPYRVWNASDFMGKCMDVDLLSK